MDFWLTNGSVFNTDTGEFEKNVNVKVSNGIIEKIGELPDIKDVIVDCCGNFLTPGLFDMHAHLVWDGTSSNPALTMEKEGNYVAMIRAIDNAKKSLQKGVTTIRDVGCCDDVTIHINHAIRKGLIQNISDIIPCGSAIMGTFGHVPQVGRIADVKSELIKAVRSIKALLTEAGEPCQWVKIMASGGAAGPEEIGPCMYDLEELKTIVKEAHRLHMKTCAHALSPEAVVLCIEAGIDTIEHGADITDEHLLKMKEKNLAYVPTLGVYSVLSKSYGILPENTIRKSQNVVDNQKDTFKRAMAQGVIIALGTDAGSMNFGEHPSVDIEMKHMSEYGMSNIEIIKSATINCAKVLGVENIKGSIAIGKQADILVLEKNPLENISAFSDSLIKIYKKGELVK